MTKSTITRERLEELAAGQSGFNLRIATHEESQELARMALAAMDSEPVAQDEREAFEAFMAKRFGDLVDQRRAKNGDYGYMAWDMVVAWTVWQARAAMLQAEPVTTANKLGNSPVIPDTWIPVSERMPEREVDVQVYCSDKKEQMVGYLERNEQDGYFRYATWRTGDGIYCQPTHWMPLPAAPQEV